MATWTIEITKTSGDSFPWKAAVVAKNRPRQEVGFFVDETEARNYAAREWRRLTANEQADAVDLPTPMHSRTQAA